MKKDFALLLQGLLLSILFVGCEPKNIDKESKSYDEKNKINIEGSKNMKGNEKVLFSFEKSGELKDWMIVNDGVMGGLSKGKISSSNSKTALFKGTVSLENYGGFTSTRTKPKSYGLDGFTGILLHVKGDGKKYQFRLRIDDKFDGISYRYEFTTKANEWITIKVPFNKCVPTFRGRILENVGPVSPEQIQQVGFLISDKQSGDFILEIDWIKAYKE